MTDSAKHWLLILKQMTMDYWKAEQVNIYLFGSIARNNNQHSSDIDIAVEWIGEADNAKVCRFREMLEESHIPYNID